MNKLNKKIVILITSTALITSGGCKKSFLDSDQLSQYSPETSLNNVAALKGALNALGANVRQEYFGDSAPMLTESIFSDVAVEGTTDKSTPAQDLISRITPDANLNSDDFNKVGWYWEQEFRGVRLANTIITNIDRPTYASPAEKNAILGAAYFYRAYHYYRLVHQFGDVPLNLKDIDAPKDDYYTTKREVILTNMKSDLEFAQASVSDNVNKGEVTKGAISHLLTKVNLALGKFDEAIASATSVISGPYALMTARFGSTAADATKNVVWDLHRMDNKALPTNREALFLVIDRETLPGFTANGSQLMRNTVPAWHFANVKTPSGATALTDAVNAEFPLTRMYGRGIGRYRGTPYSTKYIWTDNTDYRHAKGMWMDMTDLVYNNPDLKKPNATAADKALYGKPLLPYDNTNVAARFTNGALDTIRHWFGWPHYKVFINSTNALANDPYWSPPRGTNTDWYVFRLAETYLLRAEAYYWRGDLGLAMLDINAVRIRANATPLTDPSKITIGTILDERARELYWEEPRKTELTRIAYIFAQTGKTAYNGKSYNLASFSENNFFYDRIIEKNDFYKNEVPTLSGVRYRIAPYHVLWPVPASAQRFNVNGRINQNKGYSGYESNVPALDKVPD